MKQTRLFILCSMLPFATLYFAPNLSADEPPQKGIEIDARGPIHEAYAQPWQTNPGPNEPVPKKPPAPIPEEPAAERPAGKNVQWIPGYWQWDGDRKDFIWVSGFWRDVPAHRRWIMGYWADTADSNRWVSGHWAADGEQDNQYVPDPPQNDDQGPTTPAPDADSFYIPGSYFYGDNGYSYRDGYWAGCQADSMWIPARYNWTPYGYSFCSGYWDYPLADRGLLFAPAYFTDPLWYTPGWSYRPWCTVGFNGLYGSLFIGTGWGHYFFGDYYARSYLGYGISPWFSYSNRYYDPLWSYNRWTNRTNPNWARGLQSNYIARVNGTAALPPRTFAAQANAVPGAPRMVNTLAQVRASGTTLQTVTPQQRTTHLQLARQMVNQAQQLSQGAPKSATVNSRANSSSRSSATFNGPNVSGRSTTAVNPSISNRSNTTVNPGVSNRSPTTFNPNVTNRSATTVQPGISSRPTTTVNPNVSNRSPATGTSPNFGTPSHNAPRTVTPSYNAPRTATPSYSSPRTATPSYSAPRTATPSYSAPRTTSPSFSTPSIPRSQTTHSYTPAFQAPSIRAPSMSRPSYSAPSGSSSHGSSHSGGQSSGGSGSHGSNNNNGGQHR